jgi:hypothetical protein
MNRLESAEAALCNAADEHHEGIGEAGLIPFALDLKNFLIFVVVNEVDDAAVRDKLCVDVAGERKQELAGLLKYQASLYRHVTVEDGCMAGLGEVGTELPYKKGLFLYVLHHFIEIGRSERAGGSAAE